MRRIISVISILLAATGAARAMPTDMSVDRLFDLCAATSMEAAADHGAAFGWQNLAEADMEEWRTGFVDQNGGSVELVGWKRARDGKDETVSFWVATGPNAHTACAYSTQDPAGLLDALSERLGEPDSFDQYVAVEMISAWWREGEGEVSFNQVGSSASVLIKSGRVKRGGVCRRVWLE